MFLYLLLLFTIIPILELAVLLYVGRAIGIWPTITAVLLTGVAGAALAKHQGFYVLQEIKRDTSRGILPADRLMDGALVLAGGLMLLTPGFITDFAGFLFLIPFTRSFIKNIIKRKMKFRGKYRTGKEEDNYIDV